MKFGTILLPINSASVRKNQSINRLCRLRAAKGARERVPKQ